MVQELHVAVVAPRKLSTAGGESMPGREVNVGFLVEVPGDEALNKVIPVLQIQLGYLDGRMDIGRRLCSKPQHHLPWLVWFTRDSGCLAVDDGQILMRSRLLARFLNDSIGNDPNMAKSKGRHGGGGIQIGILLGAP